MAGDPPMPDALFVDFYELTMAQVYLRRGLADRHAVFDYSFRNYPDYGSHAAGYCISAGMAWFAEWMQGASFTGDVIEHLAGYRSRQGGPMFDEAFLRWLAGVSFDVLDIRAVPEGRVVHPGTPVAIVEGPLAIAQLVETSLLNHLNFQTLIATKASRVVEAARGGAVLEFGMRRAAWLGADAAARAALIGGAQATSNVGLARRVGRRATGTHAHSMVQAFMADGADELAAFHAYAEVFPDDCILLVDTIDTLESGMPHAIEVFEKLRQQGHRPVAVRLDSGDLAYLAIQAARLLDAAGFPEVGIVLSSGLDELTILQILQQIDDEASRYGVDPVALRRRLSYGVGTRMASSEGHPALDGVYKLVEIGEGPSARPAIKVSDTPAKTVDPGRKSLYRVYDRRHKATADVVTLYGHEPAAPMTLHHPSQPGVRRELGPDEVSAVEPLHEWVLRSGRWSVDTDLDAARRRRDTDVERLDTGVRRLVNPHTYHVSLAPELWNLKMAMLGELGG